MVHNEIWVLSIATLLILSVLLTLLFYLIVRKAIENRRQSEIEKIKEKMNPLLYTYLAEGNISRGLQPDSLVKEKALEELLNHYADVLEGAVEKQNLSILAELHLTDYYKRSLKSFRWSRRMNALYHIEDFKMKTLQNNILPIVESSKSTKEEVVLSLRILASFQFQKIPFFLVEKWSSLSEYDYRTILYRLDSPRLEPFILQFNQCSEQLKYALIEVISLKKELRYIRFLETIFIMSESEVRLRALKAISSIGNVSKIDPYLSLVHSAIWQERMMAAKLYGNIKDRELLPHLKTMLSDPNWWVRFQAGQSIMMFPDGKKILYTIYQTTDDLFARDMAWEWMNKGVT